MSSKRKSRTSRTFQQKLHVEWILSSENPTPLAFFRLIHPTHRQRAIQKYRKAFADALSDSPDNRTKKFFLFKLCLNFIKNRKL